MTGGGKVICAKTVAASRGLTVSERAGRRDIGSALQVGGPTDVSSEGGKEAVAAVGLVFA